MSGQDQAPAEAPAPLSLVDEIRARRADLPKVPTPWGSFTLRRKLNVAGLIACRAALGRDERESMLLVVEHGVLEPRLSREEVEAMDDDDGEAFCELAAAAMRALGFHRVSVEAQEEARRTFREGDPGSVPEPPAS